MNLRSVVVGARFQLSPRRSSTGVRQQWNAQPKAIMTLIAHFFAFTSNIIYYNYFARIYMRPPTVYVLQAEVDVQVFNDRVPSVLLLPPLVDR